MEETSDRLRQFKPDLLGFMMTTYMFPETLQWIRYLKKERKVPVVVGGYNLRVYPRESIMPDEIDFGVVEHALETVPQLLSELEGKRRFREVTGLAYKDNGAIKLNPARAVNFNDFPFPARHLLPNELYAEFPTERRNFTAMVTSLGCPYGCNFCEAGRTHYSPRTPQVVINEIEECYVKYHIREFDIFDYNFTFDKDRVTEICREIGKRKLDILWACRSRVDIGRELLTEMKRAGCGRIYYGIESGDQGILDAINKGITTQQVRQCISDTNRAGIKALGFFLIGAPGDTKETVKKTVQFAQSLNLHYVQFSKCLAKPLTPLWREMVQRTGRDYWRDWILGQETDRPVPRPWTTLTNKEIDQLTKKAYVRYHSRFRFLLRAVLQVKSFAEFKRKLLSYLEMVFSQETEAQPDEEFVAYHGDARRLDFYKKRHDSR